MEGDEKRMDLLKHLLQVKFYTLCKLCDRDIKKKSNFTCKDCMVSPLCMDCVGHKHQTHQVLQVSKVSHVTGIGADIINKFLDVSDIQHYKINHNVVVFIKQKQTKDIKGCANNVCCEVCGYKLKDNTTVNSTYKFCSIECKMKNMKEALREESQEKEEKKSPKEEKVSEVVSVTEKGSARPCPYVIRRRSRKGIPRRAPFF